MHPRDISTHIPIIRHAFIGRSSDLNNTVTFNSTILEIKNNQMVARRIVEIRMEIATPIKPKNVPTNTNREI